MTDEFGQIEVENSSSSNLTLQEIQVIGRGFAEYQMMFDISDADIEKWCKRDSFSVLDVAAGTSSFRQELAERFKSSKCKLEALAVDPAYAFSVQNVHKKANSVAEGILTPLLELNTWKGHDWVSPDMLFPTPKEMLNARLETYQAWAEDRTEHPEAYIADSLPSLASLGGKKFNLILCANLLFAYANSDLFGGSAEEVFDFHLRSLINLCSLLKENGTLLIYPIGTNSEPSYPELDKLLSDLADEGIKGEAVETLASPNVAHWNYVLLLRR